MNTNFIGLIPNFKFNQSPTFLLTCDAMGLRWLRDRFEEVAKSEEEASFIIGNGQPISSDDKCRLIVVTAHHEQTRQIRASSRSEFTWHIGRSDASVVAAKLLSMLYSNLPGHQYLDIESGRYRTVVVTKGEYPVDTVRAMRDGA